MKYLVSSRLRKVLAVMLSLVIALQMSAARVAVAADETTPATDEAQTEEQNFTDLKVFVHKKADLGITKTVDEPLPNIGGAITYSLSVTNGGPDDATGVEVTDVLPEGVTFVSADPAAEYNSATGIWTIGDLANGQTALLDINVTANLDAGDTTAVNTATVSADTKDPNWDNNTASVTVEIGIPAVVVDEPLAPCVEGPAHVNEVVSSAQGTLNNGGAITDSTRTNPAKTLGAADGVFFSIGKNGVVTDSMAGYAVDVPGVDLSIHEITNGRDTYPEERAKVEISQDGSTWFVVGTASGKDASGVSSFDIAPTGLDWFTVVRVTETTDFSIHDATADGFDLDAIDATYQSCVLVDPSKTATYDSTTGTLHYAISWNVKGGIANVTLTDALPSGITYVDGSADNGGTYDSGTRTLTWVLGSHVGGDSGIVTFDATLDAALALSQWASSVKSFTQGKDADLTTAIDAVRSNPAQALGPAETSGALYDNPLPTFVGKFVSLGFTNNPTGGELVLGFDQDIYNGPGNDLQIFEVTSGDVYGNESAKIAVSNDNSTWTDVGVVVRDGGVDLGSVTSAKYVRITDTSNKADFEPTADAFDVDAVKALQLVPNICSVVNTAMASWTVFTDNVPTTATLPAVVTTTINKGACDDSGGGNGGSGGSNTPTGSITGLVFNDANNNATLDEGESSLSGWVVYLDTNDNGILDGGEVSKTTASPYLFTGLADGTYNVREVVQSGWTQTVPTAGNGFKYVVAISGGNAVTSKDFGNFQTPTGGNGGAGGSGGSTQGTTSVGSGGGANGGGGGSIPTPQVLGDSTTTPSDTGSGMGGGTPTGQVLGATELPRTGNGSAVLLLALLVGGSAAFALRKLRQSL